MEGKFRHVSIESLHKVKMECVTCHCLILSTELIEENFVIFHSPRKSMFNGIIMFRITAFLNFYEKECACIRSFDKYCMLHEF